MASHSDQPDFAILLDWIECRLEASVAAEVARQVAAGNTRTHDAVKWLREFRAAAQELPLHDPPPLVRQNLRQHFVRWTRARAVLEQGPVELHAVLVFDSRRDVVRSSVRAADLDDEVVHLAYTTAFADLVIDARRSGRRLRLEGQVLLAEPGSAPVFEATISGPDFSARTIDGDGLGRFSLSDVPEVARRLRVSNGEIAIVAELDLGADTS
jgi:hypothetical protein